MPKLIARTSRYNIRLGELPKLGRSPEWWAQDPFVDVSGVAGLSPSLTMKPVGVTHGHHVATDSSFLDGLFVDREIPLSPLFARDLAGRAIYLGYGPEIKNNAEWLDYMPPLDEEGKPLNEDAVNPFIPLVTFPRFCRDVAEMPGAELLEEVLFCKFRCLENPTHYAVFMSGVDEDAEPLAPLYNGCNLYPYKLRLDTFYPDGYRLPQTQMLFARGAAQGCSPSAAQSLGEALLQAWDARTPETRYEDWLAAQGEDYVEDLFAQGCTLIPTFEAANGYAVVGPEFELQDYWPGRAVAGLHAIVEMRADQAPRGTILEVVRPGFVTASTVVEAQVIISDGSGYVSPNAADPLPKIPNLNLPHSRSVANWRACWIPTHPQHFEAPALWGWDPETGKFLQLAGPLWAPLHYVYGCTDAIIDAHDFPEVDEANPALIPVPEELKGRFWPVVPMAGYDTFCVPARDARRAQKSKINSILVREPTEAPTAGVAYHPLPLEFDFEAEPFWFPELNPLNRSHGLVPDDLSDRIVPVTSPQITPEQFLASVTVTESFRHAWLQDPDRLLKPSDDVMGCFPGLVRYLIPELDVKTVLELCPVPVLSDLGTILRQNVNRWWGEEEEDVDGLDALNMLGGGLHDLLWDAREEGARWIRFRHMVYQSNYPLYVLSWWFSATPELMMEQMETWIRTSEDTSLPGEAAQAEGAEPARMAVAAEGGQGGGDEDLSEEEKAQLRAIEAMAQARERNRLEPVMPARGAESDGAQDPFKN